MFKKKLKILQVNYQHHIVKRQSLEEVHSILAGIFQQSTSSTDSYNPEKEPSFNIHGKDHYKSLKSENPLEWWKENEKGYCVLSHLARKVLVHTSNECSVRAGF